MEILKIKPWQIRFREGKKTYVLREAGEMSEEYLVLYEVEGRRVKRVVGTAAGLFTCPFDRWKHGQTYKGIDTERFCEYLKSHFGRKLWE